MSQEIFLLFEGRSAQQHRESFKYQYKFLV